MAWFLPGVPFQGWKDLNQSAEPDVEPYCANKGVPSLHCGHSPPLITLSKLGFFFAKKQRAVGKIETMGMSLDDDMIDDWLSNPDIVGQLDLAENSAKPHTARISQEGDEHFVVLGSRLFWKTLQPEVVADILAKYAAQRGTAHIAEYLVNQARRLDKTAKDMSVLVLKFTRS